MIYVHKVSAEPINAYEMIRSGGPNVLVPRAKGKYLLLWNVEMIYREGLWHYIFGFDTRDTLDINPLACAVLGKEKGSSYPNKVDWLKWLGEDWETISPAKREMLLGAGNRQGALASAVVIEQLKLHQAAKIDWDPAKAEEQLAKARARKVVSHPVREQPQDYDVVLDPEDEGLVMPATVAAG